MRNYEWSKMKMNATLLKTDGSSTPVKPENGTDFKLEELYKLIGTDMVEVVPLANGRILVIDEEGKLKGKGVNAEADRLFQVKRMQWGDYIVGDAVLMDSEDFR
jgi:hypothetical protein